MYCFCHLAVGAKETGALQAAKSKLEKQVEELTWRLQLEKRMRVVISLQIVLLFFAYQITRDHAHEALFNKLKLLLSTFLLFFKK